jgi:anti-sigma factor RsiW
LHGYIDGELDLARTVEIERHLEECPRCSQAYESQRTLRDSIQVAGDLRHRCPERLRVDVEAMLRAEAGIPLIRPKSSRRWLALAASLLLVASASWLVMRSLSSQSMDSRIADEVIASHVRSLLADHLTDVASSDQHTVKPWFAGKLDFAPTVADYTSAGFPLTGGRLDYLEHRPVAALVYHRRKHAINLFIWPTADSTLSPPQSMTIHGYQIVHWTQAGTAYWMISDLNSSELGEFAQLVRGSER